MPTQGASITVQGGLDLVSSSHALFKTPGAATVLQNFESSTTGGYRRISGFEKLGGGSAVIPSGVNTDAIHGIKGYANGVVVSQGANVILVLQVLLIFKLIKILSQQQLEQLV